MSIGTNLATWLGVLAFAILLYRAWHWAGTALPPTTMIDKTLMGRPVDQTAPPPELKPADMPPEAEYMETVRIASDKMYVGAPILETVTVRAWLIETFVGTVAVVVLAGFGAARIQAMSDAVLSHPLVSAFLALVLLVPALLLGAIRQAFGYMLGRAGAIPVIDGAGLPRFNYIGDVPPPHWQHSPWFRAATWAVVAAGSLGGAWIVSLFVNQALGLGVPYGISAILTLRWLISAIPIFFLSRALSR